ncbi:MAG: tetratricopeptide repeat protein [Gammaproteobacteria bacterium]|jgi:tetratricopeptide (TPR) repeat protein
MRLYLLAFMAVICVGSAQADGYATGPSELELAQAERLAQQGEIDRALAVYRELSEEAPRSARLHARVGGMLLLKQEYAAAVNRFQTAIGLDLENNGDAFIGLGIAYVHLGQYGPARAALNEARSRKPQAAADLDQLVAWLEGRAVNREGDVR